MPKFHFRKKRSENLTAILTALSLTSPHTFHLFQFELNDGVRRIGIDVNWFFPIEKSAFPEIVQWNGAAQHHHIDFFWHVFVSCLFFIILSFWWINKFCLKPTRCCERKNISFCYYLVYIDCILMNAFMFYVCSCRLIHIGNILFIHFERKTPTFNTCNIIFIRMPSTWCGKLQLYIVYKYIVEVARCWFGFLASSSISGSFYCCNLFGKQFPFYSR